MADITIEDVKMFLLTKATAEDLRITVAYYKLRHRNLGVAAGLSFKAGDSVEVPSKTGGVIKAKFIRMMSKNALIKADNGMEYRCSPGLLKKV